MHVFYLHNHASFKSTYVKISIKRRRDAGLMVSFQVNYIMTWFDSVRHPQNGVVMVHTLGNTTQTM